MYADIKHTYTGVLDVLMGRYMKNYYEVLEIKEFASQEVIKAAYKALAKKYHPDNAANGALKQYMVEINEAYQVLSDPAQKITYDERLREHLKYVDKNKGENKEGIKKDSNIENTPPKKGKSFLIRFFEEMGECLITNMQQAQRQSEECYLKGLSMNNNKLVFQYRRATGSRKYGYARALEERGFLEKDENGRYKLTYIMKQYL